MVDDSAEDLIVIGRRLVAFLGENGEGALIVTRAERFLRDRRLTLEISQLEPVRNRHPQKVGEWTVTEHK